MAMTQTGTDEKKTRQRRPRRPRTNWRAHQLTLLHEMYESLNSTLDEIELLNRAVSLISSYFNYAVVIINMVDEINQQFVLRAVSTESSAGATVGSRLPIDKGVIGQAAKLRRPVLVADTRKSDLYVEKYPATRSELRFSTSPRGSQRVPRTM